MFINTAVWNWTDGGKDELINPGNALPGLPSTNPNLLTNIIMIRQLWLPKVRRTAPHNSTTFSHLPICSRLKRPTPRESMTPEASRSPGAMPTATFLSGSRSRTMQNLSCECSGGAAGLPHLAPLPFNASRPLGP